MKRYPQQQSQPHSQPSSSHKRANNTNNHQTQKQANTNKNAPNNNYPAPQQQQPQPQGDTSKLINNNSNYLKQLQKLKQNAKGKEKVEKEDEIDILSEEQEDEKNQYKESCLVCLEYVEIDDPIWECDQCFALLHLPCIQQWIKDGVVPFTPLSKEAFPDRKAPWYCPNCRKVYKREESPTVYTCFCKKVVNPPVDLWLQPHTCGQQCAKILNPPCIHGKCTSLCHPKACPKCPIMVSADCFCGRENSTRLCGSRKWSCGKECGKLLPCKQHRCEELCHESAKCPPCQKTSVQKCRCQRKEEVRKCSELNWSCGEVCGKVLDCGKHHCELVCHRGECGNCPKAGPKTCPCGKKPSFHACDQLAPSCGDSCEKILSCGLHECSRRCHNGECEVCLQIAVKRCRCGKAKKEIICSNSFTCEIRCQKMRNCGRHNCNKKCCVGACPPCEEVCNKKLPCGNHHCKSVCHQGMCLPCPITVDIFCACREKFIRVPCGKENYTKPPVCNAQCKMPPFCHHVERKPHKCHFGDCAPCDFICEAPLPNCLHACPNVCHDRVPSEIAALRSKGKDIRADLVPKKLTLSQILCPPCLTIVQRECMGKHIIVDKVCSGERVFSCGEKCGNLLECGNHVCQLECHELNIGSSGVSDSCLACELPCQKPRNPKCKHSCPLPCHKGECPVCAKSIRKKCHCGSLELFIPCHKLWDGNDLEKVLCCQQECQKDLPNCSHFCEKMCHSGACDSLCNKPVTVRCACKRKKEEWLCTQATALRKERKLKKDNVVLLECDEICAEQKKVKKVDVPDEIEPEPVITVRKPKKVSGREVKVNKKNKEMAGYVFSIILLLGLTAASLLIVCIETKF
eukprot:TRINITY_DN6118_c0_g2_i2.p1 TRINITY_DN6118_c0_g2~~TRINITY_DN6118_c0_g2_i2.p1  ORF type:complete len:854 (+),score=113.33 TRINITY_DN6118_c0_g2_i2:117-2678(+)